MAQSRIPAGIILPHGQRKQTRYAAPPRSLLAVLGLLVLAALFCAAEPAHALQLAHNTVEFLQHNPVLFSLIAVTPLSVTPNRLTLQVAVPPGDFAGGPITVLAAVGATPSAPVPVALAGALVGQAVGSITDLTTGASLTGIFESVISSANNIQQIGPGAGATAHTGAVAMADDSFTVSNATLLGYFGKMPGFPWTNPANPSGPLLPSAPPLYVFLKAIYSTNVALQEQGIGGALGCVTAQPAATLPGAGLALPGAQVGQKVVSAIDTTNGADASGIFEPAISAGGFIQQTAIGGAFNGHLIAICLSGNVSGLKIGITPTGGIETPAAGAGSLGGGAIGIDSHTTAGPVALPGAMVGQPVLSVIDANPALAGTAAATNVASHFQPAITVNNQIQQLVVAVATVGPGDPLIVALGPVPSSGMQLTNDVATLGCAPAGSPSLTIQTPLQAHAFTVDITMRHSIRD